MSLRKSEFTVFVEQYERLVYTICFQFTREIHTAQDLTQDTFLSAWLHMDACPKGYERQWLGRIAANKCKDYLQSAWNRRVDLAGEEEMSPGLSPPAEMVALEKLRAADAAEVIRNFSEPYGPVLRLCLLEERSVEEAAVALALTLVWSDIPLPERTLVEGPGLTERVEETLGSLMSGVNEFLNGLELPGMGGK